MLSQTANTTQVSASALQKSQILSAAILGFIIMVGVGLSPMEVAHNAAHDTRHSFAFPCH
ncbi:MAG: CbtB domain-containing protein [Bermanella sp.]